MRHVRLSWFLLSCLTVPAFAQSELDVAERIRLRELLRISATSEFSQQLKAPLPVGNSYQVFLGFGLDFEVHNNFVRWIEDWNRKQTPRYAKLIVTEDIQQAHIVLAQFSGNETIVDVATFSHRVEGYIQEKAGTKQEYYISSFSYIFLPQKSDPLHLQAIWRDSRQALRNGKDKPTDEQSKSAGLQLRDALFNLLKRSKPRP